MTTRANPEDQAWIDDYATAHLKTFIELSQVLLARRDLAGNRGARAFFTLLLEATPRWYGNPSYDPVLDAGSEAPPLPLTMNVVFEIFHRLEKEGGDLSLEERLKRVYYSDIVLAGVIQSLLIVWYNGSIGAQQAPADAYPHTLVWEAIAARPAGIPGPYFGSWAYPPPMPIVKPGAGGAS